MSAETTRAYLLGVIETATAALEMLGEPDDDDDNQGEEDEAVVAALASWSPGDACSHPAEVRMPCATMTSPTAFMCGRCGLVERRSEDRGFPLEEMTDPTPTEETTP